MAEDDAPLRTTVVEHWSRANYCGADLPRISCDHRRLSSGVRTTPLPLFLIALSRVSQ